MSAITKLKERSLDFYATPSTAVHHLLRNVQVAGTVFECCAGELDIAKPLVQAGLSVKAGDIDPGKPSDFIFDATNAASWSGSSVDWVITNPPYNQATKIIPLAYKYADKGIAMFLRLSWLEPCRNRIEFLLSAPLSYLIVLPRISFTGDGRKDSVTCAWFVWQKGEIDQKIIFVPGSKP